MLINVVNQEAEQALLSRLKQGSEHNAMRGALHFRCTGLERSPTEEELLVALKPELAQRRAALYLFRDGDIVVTWNDAQKAIMESVSRCFYNAFCPTETQERHHYYDIQAHGEDLRLLCMRKIANFRKINKPQPPPKPVIEPEPKMFEQLQIAIGSRKQRRELEILVVEDQGFSRRLLSNLLQQNYKVHDASCAEEALDIYFLHAPDVVLLDIELPGMSGHSFSEIVRRADKSAYIIMVSSNNYREDVIKAKENGVKGFIIKPYSKHKILSEIDKFMQSRNEA
jgi:CheY-like chemotaxis protein